MNEPNKERECIEHLLKQARLPAPSSQLRDRVTAAARQTWDQRPPEVPWQVPLRRLALSAAATFLVISATNHFSNHVVPTEQPGSVSASPVIRIRDTNDDSLGAWGENAPYRWGTIRPCRNLISVEAVRDRMENLNLMLDAMNHNGT